MESGYTQPIVRDASNPQNIRETNVNGSVEMVNKEEKTPVFNGLGWERAAENAA